jgi:hypothetical protein
VIVDDFVDRLYRCIVEELADRGHHTDVRLRLGDLFEVLVPYGAVRDRLGVELMADYEEAMLRLLAGDRGLLVVEDDQTRHEFEREASEPFPAVGLFRTFSDAAVRVRVAGGAGRAVSAPDPRAQGASAGAEASGKAPPASRAPVPAEDRREEPAPPAPAASPAIAGPTTGQIACAFCATQLPADRPVLFCPFCGRDQRLLTCPGCDGLLEPGLRYCIRCGREAAAD